MAYVVADPCIRCKYTDCVAVCPVDCFYEGINMLAIHPDECIDCGACEPECPTTAIFEESELPAKWEVYKGINALVTGAREASELDTSGWPEHLRREAKTAAIWRNITQQDPPFVGADEAAREDDKIADLTIAALDDETRARILEAQIRAASLDPASTIRKRMPGPDKPPRR
jgi:ferredoxin